MKRFILSMLFIGISVFACSREPVLLKVNGEPITKKELTALLSHAGVQENVKEGAQAQDPRLSGIKERLLSQLIDEKLTLQAARKERIRVDKKEVRKVYDGMWSSSGSEQNYIQGLKARGMSKDLVLKSIEKDLTIRKFKEHLSKGITVLDSELKDYYDKYARLFTVPEQFRLSIIQADTGEEAKKIRREIEKGLGFEEASAKRAGGHAGGGASGTSWVTAETFPPDIAKEIVKIKPGSFGGPVKGREGYYLIKVLEKKDKRQESFEEAKEQIRHVLAQQRKEERFAIWLRTERQNAKIVM